MAIVLAEHVSQVLSEHFGRAVSARLDTDHNVVEFALSAQDANELTDMVARAKSQREAVLDIQHACLVLLGEA